MLDFKHLPLAPGLQQGVDALGYTQPTPIQAQSLPAILDGRDVIAQAPTGSGKTAAFGLGLLHRLDVASVRTQALVLCPTRELADQVAQQLRRLAVGLPNLKVLTLCGGLPLEPQIRSLEAPEPHVVVGTPGRIQELLRKKVLHLEPKKDGKEAVLAEALGRSGTLRAPTLRLGSRYLVGWGEPLYAEYFPADNNE